MNQDSHTPAPEIKQNPEIDTYDFATLVSTIEKHAAISIPSKKLLRRLIGREQKEPNCGRRDQIRAKLKTYHFQETDLPPRIPMVVNPPRKKNSKKKGRRHSLNPSKPYYRNTATSGFVYRPKFTEKNRVTKVPTPKELRDAFYASEAWRRLRYKVLVKYGRTCMCCGITAKVIHVDHIKPRFKHPELELEFTNLQVLCEDCNLGKGAWDQTDWRPKNP